MSTSALIIFSPSSSSSTRSTPWVDGCWGPMLRTMVCSRPVAVCTVVMAQVCSSSPDPKSARPLHGIILAEGIAFPIFREQHAPEIRMAVKVNAEEVKDFAFVPIGGRPNRNHGLDHRILPGQTHPQAEDVAPRERQQMVIELKTRLDGEAVHAGNVRKICEFQFGI